MLTLKEVQIKGIHTHCYRVDIAFNASNLTFYKRGEQLFIAESLDQALMWLIAYSLGEKNGGFY